MEKDKRLQKLQLKEIINDLDIIDLKSFMYQYAKKDKHFEIALKSHFVSRLNLGDKGQKYKRILNELIKPKTINNQKISASLNKIIVFVLKDFASQMHDCLSTENYTEVFYISSSCLEKIAYLQNRFNLKNQSIESIRIELLGGIDILLKQDLAPSFRKEMEAYFKELVLRSYYIPQAENLISILDNNKVLVQEEKSEIIESLIQKNKSSEVNATILKTCIQLSVPFYELANKLITIYPSQKIFECLQLLIEERNFDINRFYIDTKQVNFDYGSEILNILESISKSDHMELSSSLLSLDPESISPIELNNIIEKLDSNYVRKEFKKIKPWIDRLSFGLKTSLYYKAQNYKDLIKLLSEKNEFEWLKVYDQQLIEADFTEELELLYHNNLFSYLNNHIGANSKIYFEKLSQRLVAIGQEKILTRITHKISAHFEHRKSIKSLLN